MKHVKVLSNEMPVQQRLSWVQLKNITGTLPLGPNQANWLTAQVDQKTSTIDPVDGTANPVLAILRKDRGFLMAVFSPA